MPEPSTQSTNGLLQSPGTWVRVLLFTCLCLGSASAELSSTDSLQPLLSQFCFDCHDGRGAEAGIDLRGMIAEPSFATDFKDWRKVVEMLETEKMPPDDEPRPNAKQRQQLVSAIRRPLSKIVERTAGDPGDVIVRRLTSAEYSYTIQDLTGLDLDLTKELDGDAVGGEGFTNIGSVQFLQDSTLERYLHAAKLVAGHAVIGSGPLQFYQHPGKTGFELSAINRIREIYQAHGFRTAAGEGGEPFGLDLYERAFFVAWQYKHRREIGKSNATLASLAAEDNLDTRFVEYIWLVLNQDSASHPTSEIVDRWKNLPKPERADAEILANAREQCGEVYRLLRRWQDSLGQNAEDKEQAFLLAADSFEVLPTKSFVMTPIRPNDSFKVPLRIFVEGINEIGIKQPLVIWRDASVQVRFEDNRRGNPRPLREFLAKQEIRRLGFGKQHDIDAKIGPDDFVTRGAVMQPFELTLPKDARSAKLSIGAEFVVESGPDCILRCGITEAEQPVQGQTVLGLLADPASDSFRAWQPGVLDFARTFPQVSQREPAPSDRDPIPSPFDNTYNNPERNHFHYKIKYHRDDRFLVDHILDDETRQRLDQAWADLLGSFEYHDAFLRFVADKYKQELSGKTIDQLDAGWINRLPPEPRRYVRRLHREYRSVQQSLLDAQPGHLSDTIEFASRAWRRPLAEDERRLLRDFYQQLKTGAGLDHRQAIRTLLVRILTSPQFLFRAERPQTADEIAQLSDWELASRLSYFLWSSLPDDELRRAAKAGELKNPQQLTIQARRMLRDPKSRRLASEFFGQWFGFYRFDRYNGIDPKRFPEFTNSLKTAMHDEAVSFFEHIIRNERPVNEILFADYTFINRELAEHYGIRTGGPSNSRFERVQRTRLEHRGGLFGLGAVLTVTSAPLRTSPVKRGDWILRRVLATPVPPPPPDAGSIPADDVRADGLTVRKRLETHRRDVSCRNCHSRIDPLGFALENYDAIGRWRDRYRDGQPIDASGTLNNGEEIDGPNGLRDYLRKNEQLFQRTLCAKLLGYALGRSESVADQKLIARMMVDIEEDGRFGKLVERIVSSKQFRFQRGTIDGE